MSVDFDAAELVYVADVMAELGSVPLDRCWRRIKCLLIISSGACTSPSSVRAVAGLLGPGICAHDQIFDFSART